MVTHVLKMMLNDNRHDYGQPDAQSDFIEAAAVPNAKQLIADSAAGGSFVEDNDN
ncbi:hypothetical protein AcW1_009327 [Taiwanofungus camphoratus]|nr:hypothetical protein AcW1_009327 [Antrodia cinnamomea]